MTRLICGINDYCPLDSQLRTPECKLENPSKAPETRGCDVVFASKIVLKKKKSGFN